MLIKPTMKNQKKVNQPNGILILFHCKENTGYAISSLEHAFIEAAKRSVGNNIHISFSEISPHKRKNKIYAGYPVIEFNPRSYSIKHVKYVSNYISKNNIDTVLGFDQPPGKPYYKHFRNAGIKRIISYWGAPMSSINYSLKLFIKKIEMKFRRHSPDFYIFESEAMRETAIKGRGISANKTRVVYLGVDSTKFSPKEGLEQYPHDIFNIPTDRKIIFYSGHFEERKGIAILIKAAIALKDIHKRNDFHFLLMGNKAGEESRYLSLLEGRAAKNHVTFGGYRNDLHKIHQGCKIGCIASTGWDSFTMSALEMASSGLPLLVSDLQGLRETVTDGETGFLFKASDHLDLSSKISSLLDDEPLRIKLSKRSRQRILDGFTIEKQIHELAKLI